MFLFAALHAIVVSAYTGSRVVAALFALTLGASPVEVGALVGMFALLTLVLAVQAGKISDRVGVRMPLAGGALCIGVALAVPFMISGVPMLFACATLAGLGFAFWNTSMQNLTGNIGRPDQRTGNFNTLSLSFAVGNLAGPMAAGFAIEFAGHATSCLLFGLIMVIPALGVLCSRSVPSTGGARINHSDGGSLQLLRAPALLRALLISALVVTGSDLYAFYLPIYGNDVGMRPAVIGALLGAHAAATFVARFLLPILSRHMASDRILAAAMAGAAGLFLIFPAFSDAIVLGSLSFALGLLLGCGQPLTMALVYGSAPAGRAGEVMGMRITVNYLMHFIVPIVAGAAGAAFGMAPVFWINAVGMAACGLLARRRETVIAR